MNLHGLHHVSALTADPVRNHDFYTRVLGLRLVKKTVNQDSPGMYHLFYADGVGSPGTDLTFFDFPRAAREHRGNNAITLTTYRVTGPAALNHWETRLTEHGVTVTRVTRDGREHLDLEDPDGTRLALFDDGGEGPRGQPNPRTDVPVGYQLQGLGYSGLTVANLPPTRHFLESGLNLREDRSYPDGDFTTHVFVMGGGGPHAELHVTVRGDLPPSRPGAGSVHHLALRMTDQAELRAWLLHLADQGYGNSGEIDRYYFRSIYIRDPNGLVIELATDGPGFATDEPLDTLGQALALPPFLEARRHTIEAHLRPLNLTEGARA